MRNLYVTALFISVLAVFMPHSLMAQTYYIAPSGGSSGSLYNAPSSSGGNAPLNLKAMVQGNATKAVSRTGYTYKGKPYGIDRSSYSLALSPEQARQNNIKSQRAAEARKRETEKLRAKALAEHKKSGLSRTEKEMQQYLNRFQGSDDKKTSPQQRKKVLYYNQNNNGSAVPRRVFNTPY